MADDEGTGGLFAEPEGFYKPSPRATQETFVREHCASTTPVERRTLSMRLVSHHPLWGHKLYNSSMCAANWMDEGIVDVRGRSVLELGAGAGLPSVVAALNGAACVVCTDYPDQVLIDNIAQNLLLNGATPPAVAQGFLWGRDVEPLLALNRGRRFDVLLLCDLVFNWNQHEALLDTVCRTLAPHGTAWVFFCHHRPQYTDADCAFLTRAAAEPFALQVRPEGHVRMQPVFPQDPGSLEVRSTVHVHSMRHRDSESQ